MKIYVGADHRGFRTKDKIIGVLNQLGHKAVDVGAFDELKSCDYPKIAQKVATGVANSRNSQGILVCMTGIGQAMAANKVRGAYAALCYNAQAAALARQHNNANILVLSAKFCKSKDIKRIVKAWFAAKFEGGRHKRRFDQIRKIEKGKKLKS